MYRNNPVKINRAYVTVGAQETGSDHTSGNFSNVHWQQKSLKKVYAFFRGVYTFMVHYIIRCTYFNRSAYSTKRSFYQKYCDVQFKTDPVTLVELRALKNVLV